MIHFVHISERERGRERGRGRRIVAIEKVLINSIKVSVRLLLFEQVRITKEKRGNVWIGPMTIWSMGKSKVGAIDAR